MKKIIQYMVAGLLLMMVNTSCKDNENWRIIPYEPEPPQTINITGTATVYPQVGEASLLKEIPLDKGDGFDEKADMIGILTWLKASGEFTITDSGIAYGKGDVTSTDPFETVNLKEGGAGFTVAEDGLYYVVMNNTERQLTVIPAKIGIIGDATPNAWNGETVMEMSFDPAGLVVTSKWSGTLSNKQLKYRFSGDWGASLPYGDVKARVHTNFGSVGENDGDIELGTEAVQCVGGGKNFKIAKNGEYDVTLVINLNTQDVTGTAKLTKEDTSTATLPEHMYINGSPFSADWNWSVAPELTSLQDLDGVFFGIFYFEAGAGLKFNSNRDWDGGEFGATNGEPCDYGEHATGGSNMNIAEAGFYQVAIVCTLSEDKQSVLKKIVLEKVKPFLIGDCVGAWDIKETNAFTLQENIFISPACPNNGVLRMCVKLLDCQWWQSEFTLKDGEIFYRGRGGEDAMKLTEVAAGQTVRLDFKTGTGSVN